MTLARALNNAQSGLATTGFRADIAANNIANASTPGYVRRQAVINETSILGQGNGVSISGAQRQEEQALARLIQDSISASSRADILANAYETLDTRIGDPDAEFGLFNDLQSFEAALRELGGTPESSILQNSVYQSSQDLVTQLKNFSQTAQDLRVLADENISKEVEKVNGALNRLNELNGEITSLSSGGGDANTLIDERQRLLREISEFIPIKDLPKEGGQIDVITQEGVFLITGGQVNALEFTRSTAITPDARYGDGTNRLSGITVGTQNLTPSSNTRSAVSSGTLAGYFSIRDDIATTFSDQVDSLAGDLITRFSDDALDDTKAPGAPGLFTDNGAAFDPANSFGAAARISINAAIDPTQGGQVWRLRDGIGATQEGPVGNGERLSNYLDALVNKTPAPANSGVSGSVSFEELVAGFSSVVGQNKVRADAIQAGTNSRLTLLQDNYTQRTAVDVDQELQSLLVIEQSYAANARVLQTVNSMFDTLLQL